MNIKQKEKEKANSQEKINREAIKKKRNMQNKCHLKKNYINSWLPL